MCRLLLDDDLKAACTLFWISGFGLHIIVQAAFTFCGADETRGKTSTKQFLRLPAPWAAGGVNVDMAEAQRHAHRPNTPSAIQKAACTFRNGGAGCFFRCVAKLSPILQKRKWVCRCRQRAACILRTMSKSNMQAAFSNWQQICPLSRGRGLGRGLFRTARMLISAWRQVCPLPSPLPRERGWVFGCRQRVACT